MAASQTAPSGPRRGGYRGGRSRHHVAAAAAAAKDPAKAQPDDTEEVRILRKKYASQLGLLRELFGDWTDEDLLFALQETGGEIELAVGRISEGQVEQFSSVKSKKQTRKESTPAASAAAASASTTAASSAVAPAPASTNGFDGPRGTASGRPSRGAGVSHRGGRGGARGGFRGGTSGGRGGGIAPQTNGHVKESSAVPTTTAPTSTGPTWAEAIAKANGQHKVPITAQSPALPTSFSAKKLAASVVDPAPATWDVESQASGAAAPAALPAPSALKSATPAAGKTWAQIAQRQESPKPQPLAPVAAPPTAEVPAIPESTLIEDVAADQCDELPVEATTVEELVVGPMSEDSVETTLVETTAAPVEESAELETAEKPVVSLPTATPVAVTAQVLAAAAAAAAAPSKPAVRPAASQRALARFKQDRAVVVAGRDGLDNLGVQFGGLSFLGGDDNDVPEPAAAATSAPAASSIKQIATPQGPTPTSTSSCEQHIQASVHQHEQQSRYAEATQQTQEPSGLSHQQAAQDPQSQQSSYGGFRSDAFGQGYGGFVQTQQQTSQQHQQTQSPPEQSPYGAINNNAASQTQQTQTPIQANQGLQDYSVYGGLDTNRLASFYGSYDQSGFGSRGEEQQRASQQSQQSAQQGAAVSAQDQQASQQPHQHHHHLLHQQQPHHQQSAPPAGAHQQHQQPYPAAAAATAMPYYYPHYYMPGQFQHYGQPGAYGQYALYSGHGQPQKPGTPASLASPYGNQAAPDINAYGSQGGYGQNPAAAGGLGGSYSAGLQDSFGGHRLQQGVPAAQSDYAKIYGAASGGAASSIPGLGGFLGAAPPSQGQGSLPSNAVQSTPQESHLQAHSSSSQKSGAAMGPAGLQDPKYSRYDAGKQQNGAGPDGSVARGPQAQQSQQQIQQQQGGPAQQHHAAPYYQQYSGYNQPTNSNYGAYPYAARGYWGQ